MPKNREPGAGLTTKAIILSNRFGDGSGRCWAFAEREVCRNSPPPTLQFTTIPTWSATFTHSLTSCSTSTLFSPNGAGYVRHKFRRLAPTETGLYWFDATYWRQHQRRMRLSCLGMSSYQLINASEEFHRKCRALAFGLVQVGK